MQPPDSPRLTRHADHDPSLTCRPALGYGLCEVLETAVPPPHGTYAAAAAHQARQEEKCDLCKRAAALYMKAYRDRGKAAPGLGWPLVLVPSRPRRWFPGGAS